MTDLFVAMDSEDWVRRHVKDRGWQLTIHLFDGGLRVTVVLPGERFVTASSAWGDEWSAWSLVADMLAPWVPEDDPSEQEWL